MRLNLLLIIFLFCSCIMKLSVEYDGGGNCIDQDGDGYGERCEKGEDCDDQNPYAWISCDTCKDFDGDGYYSGVCDKELEEPDCDDTTILCTTDCETDIDQDSIPDCKDGCIDKDGDGYGNGTECQRLDCDDEDPNNWISCDTCKDDDGDGFYVNCDRYVTIEGPDCNDMIAQCNISCEDIDDDGILDCVDGCIDKDGDQHGIGECEEDCDDEDPNNWISCDTCKDVDGDGFYVNCDRYVTIQLDCDDEHPQCNIQCIDNDEDGLYDCADTCFDRDRDGYGDEEVCLTSPRLCSGCIGIDCDDTRSDIYPREEGICDEALDHNCNGIIDQLEGCPNNLSQCNNINLQLISSLEIIGPDNDIHTFALFIYDHYAYIGLWKSNHAVAIVDITDPTAPSLVDYIDLQSTYVYDILVQDDIIYIGTDHGLKVIRRTTLDPITEVLSNYNIKELFATSEYIFISTFNGVLFYNISEMLQQVGIATIISPEISYSLFVKESDNILTIGERGKFKVLDISNINNPTLIEEVNITNNVEIRDIWIDDYIYLTAYRNNNSIYLYDKLNYTELASSSITQLGYKLFISGKYMFVAAWNDGIYVFDISDIYNNGIAEVINYRGAGESYVSLFVVGDILYACDFNRYLRIFRIECN